MACGLTGDCMVDSGLYLVSFMMVLFLLLPSAYIGYVNIREYVNKKFGDDK